MVAAMVGVIICEIVRITGDIGSILFLIVLAAAFVLAIPAGLAASWLLPDTGDPKDLRDTRIRQGLIAGVVAGAACGVVLTYFSVVAMFMMVLGPMAGALAGVVGGAVAADHPRRPLPDGSRAAGLFVLMSDWLAPRSPLTSDPGERPARRRADHVRRGRSGLLGGTPGSARRAGGGVDLVGAGHGGAGNRARVGDRGRADGSEADGTAVHPSESDTSAETWRPLDRLRRGRQAAELPRDQLA